jgi:hypothetical protein
MPPSRWSGGTALAATVIAAAACGGAEGEVPDLAMRTDTVGDTIIVRTEHGSVWGSPPRLEEVVRIGALEGSDEYVFGRIAAVVVAPDGRIYVLDTQVPAVRVYDRAGRHVLSFGRRGEGPGEMRQPTGLALLPDGRVLVSDPGNARVVVYSPDGEALDAWRIPGGFFSNDQIRVTDDGRAYVLTLLSELGSPEMISGLVLTGPEGTAADTIIAPTWDFQPPTLTAQFQQGENRSMSLANVPFAPVTTWTLLPDGQVAGGVSTRYAIDVARAHGRTLRIERNAAPVAVAPDERSYHQHRTTTNLRRTDPNWRWSGPPIPDTKAPFSNVRADADGRLWVRVATAGEIVPPSERPEPQPGSAPGPEPWREPLAFDVFETDGRFLGTVTPPRRFTLHGARGDRLWGTVLDEYDVAYVVVLRLDV